MKITKRKVELTIEKSAKFFVRRRITISAWCGFCEQHVEMLPPEESAGISGVPPRMIYRLIETNQIHFIETDDGQLLVCFNSLFRREDTR